MLDLAPSRDELDPIEIASRDKIETWELERQGVDPRSTSLKVGIFGAEPWTEEMRAEMERGASTCAPWTSTGSRARS